MTIIQKPESSGVLSTAFFASAFDTAKVINTLFVLIKNKIFIPIAQAESKLGGRVSAGLTSLIPSAIALALSTLFVFIVAPVIFDVYLLRLLAGDKGTLKQPQNEPSQADLNADAEFNAYISQDIDHDEATLEVLDRDEDYQDFFVEEESSLDTFARDLPNLDLSETPIFNREAELDKILGEIPAPAQSPKKVKKTNTFRQFDPLVRKKKAKSLEASKNPVAALAASGAKLAQKNNQALNALNELHRQDEQQLKDESQRVEKTNDQLVHDNDEVVKAWEATAALQLNENQIVLQKEFLQSLSLEELIDFIQNRFLTQSVDQIDDEDMSFLNNLLQEKLADSPEELREDIAEIQALLSQNEDSDTEEEDEGPQLRASQSLNYQFNNLNDMMRFDAGWIDGKDAGTIDVSLKFEQS